MNNERQPGTESEHISSEEQLREELFKQLEHLLRFYIINTIVMYFENGHDLLSNALKSAETNGSRRIDNIFMQIDKVKEIWDSYIIKNNSEEVKRLSKEFIDTSELFKQKIVQISELTEEISKVQMEALKQVTVPLFNSIKKGTEFLSQNN